MTACAILSLLVFSLIVGLRKNLPSWLKSFGCRGNASSSHVHAHGHSNRADIKRVAPYPAAPIKGRQRYRVMMDVRKLDEDNWLTMDKNYLEEHQIRAQLLAQQKRKVLQSLPESYDACVEALHEVVGFLCARFPDAFAQSKSGDEVTVQNKMTGETFVFGGEKNAHVDPLEVAVRLTMEDLSILMKNPDDEYYMAASASLFPVGWTVEERIGWTISQLHNPVPLWHQQVASSVSKFLNRLTPANPMERSNYFVEVKRPDENLFEILYRPSSLSEPNPSPAPEDIVIRRERQTFRRLPRSGALVFGVKTVLTTLDELPLQELCNLATEIRSWPDYVGAYKGAEAFGPTALEFCERKAREHGLDV